MLLQTLTNAVRGNMTCFRRGQWLSRQPYNTHIGGSHGLHVPKCMQCGGCIDSVMVINLLVANTSPGVTRLNGCSTEIVTPVQVTVSY